MRYALLAETAIVKLLRDDIKVYSCRLIGDSRSSLACVNWVVNRYFLVAIFWSPNHQLGLSSNPGPYTYTFLKLFETVRTLSFENIFHKIGYSDEIDLLDLYLHV